MIEKQILSIWSYFELQLLRITVKKLVAVRNEQYKKVNLHRYLVGGFNPIEKYESKLKNI